MKLIPYVPTSLPTHSRDYRGIDWPAGAIPLLSWGGLVFLALYPGSKRLPYVVGYGLDIRIYATLSEAAKGAEDCIEHARDCGGL